MSKAQLKTTVHDLSELADTLKSVAHADRLAIMHLLCSSSYDQLEVKSIYSALNLSQSTVSRHLSIMKSGGLLKSQVSKGKTYYRLNWQSSTAVCLREMLTKTR